MVIPAHWSVTCICIRGICLLLAPPKVSNCCSLVLLVGLKIRRRCGCWCCCRRPTPWQLRPGTPLVPPRPAPPRATPRSARLFPSYPFPSPPTSSAPLFPPPRPQLVLAGTRLVPPRSACLCPRRLPPHFPFRYAPSPPPRPAIPRPVPFHASYPVPSASPHYVTLLLLQRAARCASSRRPPSCPLKTRVQRRHTVSLSVYSTYLQSRVSLDRPIGLYPRDN